MDIGKESWRYRYARERLVPSNESRVTVSVELCKLNLTQEMTLTRALWYHRIENLEI